MGRKRFQWVEKCFQHFFETFSDINDNTKMALIILEKSIEELFEQNEEKIAEKAKTANNEESLMQYHVYIDQEKTQL